MSDEIRKNQSPVGDDALAYVNSFLTKDEKAEIALEVQLMKELTAARKEKKMTQKQLGDLCGLPQSAIARIEKGENSPSIATVTKVLSALGKRLCIVITTLYDVSRHSPASTLSIPRASAAPSIPNGTKASCHKGSHPAACNSVARNRAARKSWPLPARRPAKESEQSVSIVAYIAEGSHSIDGGA